MEVTLKPDNRKATIIAGINDDLVKVKLEDGREFAWPVSKINIPQKEGEETLKVVVIPAIDRLRELDRELLELMSRGVVIKDPEGKLSALQNELKQEAVNEFAKKC